MFADMGHESCGVLRFWSAAVCMKLKGQESEATVALGGKRKIQENWCHLDEISLNNKQQRLIRASTLPSGGVWNWQAPVEMMFTDECECLCLWECVFLLYIGLFNSKARDSHTTHWSNTKWSILIYKQVLEILNYVILNVKHVVELGLALLGVGFCTYRKTQHAAFSYL